jgi:type I restriction enzyme, R subunit
MNSNFSFLQEEWSSLHSKMTKAEERVNTEPISSASYCRLAMEEAIHKLYDLEYIDKPYNTDLVSLMTEEEIKQLIPFQLNNGLHIVRKTGNNAAHFGQRVAGRDALIAVKYLFDFFRWFARTYSDNIPETSVSFNMDFVPKIGSGGRKAKELQLEREKEQEKLMAQVAQLLKEKDALLEKAQETEQSLEEYKANEEAAKVALKAQKKQRVVPITSEFTEAETRQHLIDVDLKEAGWDKLVEGRELEHPVKGMPITSDNPKGNGFVDYVLWGEDGKPLALVEAKRASKDIEIGKHQAFLYANCLEEMYGQRPVIFYTNGYETKLWDDTFYSTPRRVYGFYTQDELQWLVQQRQTRKDIRKASVNEDIAGRFYQIEAIQRVAESFSVDGDKGLRGNKREVLLVMATGSGKTRTSAALVDVLMKNNWTKRVLFLADRNALVRQAQRNFGDYLPDLSSIDLTEEKENDTTRLVFSTYPSMMNRIDNVRNSDERFYGVGHFDLIIVDEAHRSVYNRYKSIFDYFDAMVVGLTATPKDSIDHNTFELFGCSNEDPTFAYELKEATPTYLCDYTNKDVSTDFIRDGIKYSELSDEDKKKYETAFADPKTGLFPDEIGSKEINKSLFNKDTVDKVLDALMNEGIKIEGGG